MIRRRGLLRALLGALPALLGAGLAPVAAGCATPDRPSAATSTLTILYPGGDRVLGLPEDDSPKLLAFLPLVTVDDEGEPVGELARSWERTPGTNRWTYHLRTDVRWHDGSPFTARDILFTLDLKLKVGWATPGRFDAALVDDSTFTVTYHQMPYFGLFHMNDWEVFYPRHLLGGQETKEFGSWEFWVRPVGNGPYRFVRNVSRTMIELEANPDYCCGKPRIDRVILKLGEPSLPELLSGNVDMMPIDLLSALKVRDDPRFRVYYALKGGDRLSLVWNHRNSLFAEARVRRALTLAIDRRELHRVLNLPPDLPISDAVFTWRQYLRGEIREGLPHDPAEASRLLEAAGWRDAEGDGVREKGERPFRFTAIVPPEGREAAVYLQEQLRRVGVKMEIRTLEMGLTIRRLLAGEFEAVVLPVNNELRGRRGLVSLFGASSALDYRNPRVVELMEALEEAIDPEEIEALYRELAPIFEEEFPVTYLSPRAGAWAAHRRVRGLEAFRNPNPFSHIQDLWIEEVE